MVTLGFNRISAQQEQKTKKFPNIKDIWETLKPRELEDFPAYGEPPPKAPDHWKTVQHNYVFNGEHKQAELTISTVPNPERITIYAVGWNSTPPEKQDVIDGFNHEWNSKSITLPLLEADMRTDTMPENIERLASLAFNDDSILKKLNPDNLPVSIVTHSAGGQTYVDAVTDKISQIKNGHNIVGVQNTATMVDAANASRLFHPVRSLLYEFYASMNHDKYVGTTFLDRAYYLVTGQSDRLRTENPTSRPTHGQNLMLIYGGRQLSYISEQLRDSGDLHHIPRETYWYSLDDNFSGHEAIIHLAKARGVPDDRIIPVSGGHSILEQPENRALMLEVIKRDEAEHLAYINRPHTEQVSSLAQQFLDEICDELEIPDESGDLYPHYIRGGALHIHTPAL